MAAPLSLLVLLLVPRLLAEPLPRRVLALEGGASSTDLWTVGASVYPITGLDLSGWLGFTQLMHTRGFGLAYTHRVLDWEQPESSWRGGLAGQAELRVGAGGNLKAYESCLFGCVTGRTWDGFGRAELLKHVASHLALQASLDVGMSVLDPEDLDAHESYLYLASRFGLAFTL
jgi:hypothetical protein